MNIAHIFRSLIVAALVAAACSRWGLGGVILSVAVCAVALMALPRPTGEPVESTQSVLRGFLPWLVCTGLFAAFTLALAPFAELPTVPIALLVFSPVVGMMVLVIESGLAAAFWRCLGRQPPSEMRP
jgi:hypothetical protein